TRTAIPVIDHNIRYRFNTVLKKNCEGRSMFIEGAVTIVETKIFSRIIACTISPCIGGRRQPDQIEVTGPDGAGDVFDDDIPVILAISRKLLGVAMPIGFPIKSLQHYPIVLESCLRKHDRNDGKDQQKNDR